MFKKTITYEDYNGVKRTEDFHFHFSKAEIIEMQLSTAGVSKGVLYPQSNGTYPKGVAWSGLTAVNEAPEGAEANPMYADNIKYLNILSAEEFKATIEAYTYPDEFKPCIGAEELIEGVSLGQHNVSYCRLINYNVIICIIFDNKWFTKI